MGTQRHFTNVSRPSYRNLAKLISHSPYDYFVYLNNDPLTLLEDL